MIYDITYFKKVQKRDARLLGYAGRYANAWACWSSSGYASIMGVVVPNAVLLDLVLLNLALEAWAYNSAEEKCYRSSYQQRVSLLAI